MASGAPYLMAPGAHPAPPALGNALSDVQSSPPRLPLLLDPLGERGESPSYCKCSAARHTCRGIRYPSMPPWEGGDEAPSIFKWERCCCCR